MVGRPSAPDSAQEHRRLPETNEGMGLRTVLRVASHVAVLRTLRLRWRFGGWCVVSRGTRVKLGPGARLEIPRGSYLFLGFAHFTPSPCAMHLGRAARVSVSGTVQIHRGARVFVNDGAHLSIGTRTYISDCSTITCFDRIQIGSGCSISWNTNILDSHIHELDVDGVARPRTQRLTLGDRVWVGTGATLLAGVTVGDGAVIAAGSVVTSPVPAGTVAAGNPARVVRQDVHWRQLTALVLL